jgi:di/tricarboxylate transporter
MTQPQGFTQGSVRAGAQPAATGGGRGMSKPFFMMSEFLTLVAITLALLIAAAIDDDLGATIIWPLITLLGFGYILSRGLAKRDARDSSDLPDQARGL